MRRIDFLGLARPGIALERPNALAGPRAGKGVWPVKSDWNRETENLYSAWIETLFDAPLDEAPSWKAMHEVLRDPSRNVLFNHLGLREDQKGLVIQPDCADVPYFLRAYFAFKMGLPFGYAKCTRGDGGQAPRCTQWWNIVERGAAASSSAEQFAAAQSVCSACSAAACRRSASAQASAASRKGSCRGSDII